MTNKKETNFDEMSMEELEKIKAKQLDFMNDQLKYLVVEESYMDAKANIAESRLREYIAKIKLATAMAPPPKQPKDEG
jgi:hypothetical protein